MNPRAARSHKGRLVTGPRFSAPAGTACEHGYPPGECCPACGEVPVDHYEDEHAPDCECFACEEIE